MFCILPLRVGHVQAELGKPDGSSTKNVAINNPSPEKHMLLLLADRLNVAEGNIGPQAIIKLFWPENEFVSFRLGKGIEIGVFIRNGILNCYGHFVSTIFRRSGSTIDHSQVKTITGYRLFGVRRNGLKISLIKRDKCSLGCYRSFVSIAISLEQEITKYCQYSGEEGSPSCGFISKNLIVKSTYSAVVSACFLLAMGSLGFTFICARHRLECQRPFWIFMALLSLSTALRYPNVQTKTVPTGEPLTLTTLPASHGDSSY
jgi:hypothetical protein